MPYNGSGTFVRLSSWVVDAANGIDILSTKMDAEDNGFAAGLTNCITRDGQSPPSADIPWGGKRLMNLGTATAGTDALNRDTADARYLLQTITALSLSGTLTIGGLITGNAGIASNGFLNVDTTVPVSYSASRAGQVGYHLYNQGAVAEWVLYQPAHATDDDYHVGQLAAGVITDRLRISASTGAVTIGGALSVGGTLAVTGVVTVPTPTVGDNSTKAATTAFVATALVSYAPLASPALTGTPTAPTATAGTATTQLATTAFVDALRDVPSNAKTANYTLALTDRGGGVDFNGTSLTCTIPANASVAFPVGATIVLTNINSTSLSIAITTDTLTLAGTTTTGTRTLAQNGMATLRKIGTTSWLISGAGLS